VGEACDERGRDGGPTGELSLERGHGGHRLRRGAEPQDACFVLVFNGRAQTCAKNVASGLSQPTTTVKRGSCAGK
jgi:hypothetical protein